MAKTAQKDVTAKTLTAEEKLAAPKARLQAEQEKVASIEAAAVELPKPEAEVDRARAALVEHNAKGALLVDDMRRKIAHRNALKQLVGVPVRAAKTPAGQPATGGTDGLQTQTSGQEAAAGSEAADE